MQIQNPNGIGLVAIFGPAEPAPEKLTCHSARAADGYGFDAWVTNRDGEVIGDGWDCDEVEARVVAIRDAQFTIRIDAEAVSALSAGRPDDNCKHLDKDEQGYCLNCGAWLP